MKARSALSLVSLVVLWSGAALAQDPVKVASANYKVILDNPSVRVLKVTYAPGAKSAMHSHGESIVIPLAATKVRFTGPDGKIEEPTMDNESATYLPPVTHSVTNIGTGPIDGILVEFKGDKPGTATLPDTRANLGTKVLVEGARGVAYRATAEPAFHEPAGSKHEFDQVVISLGSSQMSLAIEGKPAKTKWARGDVQFIPRGAAHESKNDGAKPADFVIVAVK